MPAAMSDYRRVDGKYAFPKIKTVEDVLPIIELADDPNSEGKALFYLQARTEPKAEREG